MYYLYKIQEIVACFLLCLYQIKLYNLNIFIVYNVIKLQEIYACYFMIFYSLESHITIILIFESSI